MVAHRQPLGLGRRRGGEALAGLEAAATAPMVAGPEPRRPVPRRRLAAIGMRTGSAGSTRRC
jgi:hypothetical protein